MKCDTVEVLVRIPKKDFEELQSNYVWWGKHGEYIKKGTVLPKGHGRLIDADAINIHDVSPAYGMEVYGVTQDDLEYEPTIIEADKDGE